MKEGRTQVRVREVDGDGEGWALWAVEGGEQVLGGVRGRHGVTCVPPYQPPVVKLLVRNERVRLQFPFLGLYHCPISRYFPVSLFIEYLSELRPLKISRNSVRQGFRVLLSH